MIDKRPDLWPVEKLLLLKEEHEAWTALAAARPAARVWPSADADPDCEPLTVPQPGDIVNVDGEPYRLSAMAGDGRSKAEDSATRLEGGYVERWAADGSTVWCQAHAYDEGPMTGHVWLRWVGVVRDTEHARAMRAAIADEAALLTDLPRLPGLPDLRSVEMTVHTAALVTDLSSLISVRTLGGARDLAVLEAITVLFRGLPTLCEALGELHDRGLAHRALTPATILVAGDGGGLRLRDVGLATMAARPGDGPGGYRAGPRTDVHQLGMIVYEIVAGRPPTRRDRQVAPSTLNPAVPVRADRTILRALATDPAARGDVRRFGRELHAVVSGGRASRRY